MVDRHILDNRIGTVAGYLAQTLAGADDFCFVSAYFTIHGYALLADQLESVGRTRFLFGDPGSVENVDPGEKDPKAFELTEGGLEPRQVLVQKALARRCAAWVRHTVEIRAVRRANFLHGKMYLTASPHGRTVVVGSSNFTRRGLGGGNRPNLEINLASEDEDTVQALREWFDQLWADDGSTRDVKGEVLEALAHLGNDYAPEAVYYKTLYEVFRQEIAARQDRDDSVTATGFKDSQVWNTLYQFQKDGAMGVIAKLRDHNGCILADSVGLGKTYTALAVIKYFELQNKQVLVLCPRKLQDNWSLYPASNGHRHNPFLQDRFGYTLLAHTDLSRTSGRSGSVNLTHFNWGNYDLVVIDESHNFRNDGSRRYQRLLEDVIKAGVQTRVLMLSATPVNTSLIDLRNQVYLMTEGRERAFQDSLGVGDIRTLMAQAQKKFKQWEQQQLQGSRRDKAQLLDQLGPDFLRLLNGVSISRSRRQIEQFYADEMERIGQFPRRARPINESPPTDSKGALSYQDLAEQMDTFKLAVYQPSAYVVDQRRLEELERKRKEQNFNQKDSERFLVGMMRVNVLKRLESSAHALWLTMDRTISKIESLLEKIERYEQGNESRIHELVHGEALPDDDEEDEEFVVNRSRNPYRLSELDLPRWRADLRKDHAVLSQIRDRVATVTPERDSKLRALQQRIRHKASQPNRKLLVFTTFKDTAKYLYFNLKPLTQALGITMAMVAGDETLSTSGRHDFNSILTNFAPVARQRREADATHNIDLLLATDCISEGQNLQDCDTVLNYDIHWNPVRLVQRFGRIDRIGNRNPSVQMVNYWPTDNMEAYLRLQNRVQARMALADLTASGDEDPFSEADMAGDLRFRDAQLLAIRDEVLDLEDLGDAPVLADFTLDHFLAQLLRYLERNKDHLETMPLGVYAVTRNHAQTDPQLQPGVIFCLRQRNAATDKQHRPASPVHPHYLVSIQSNGAIRYGCGSTRTILTAFAAATAGQTRPITQLCHRFDQETQNGRRMDHYETLLSACITQIRQAHHRQQTAGLGRSGAAGFKLPRVSETPRGAGDFELVTWLIMKEAP